MSKSNQKIVLATAAATLLLSGCIFKEYNYEEIQATTEVKCKGINSCKGTSACKSHTNACKGLNKCKGTGWVFAKKSACIEAQGMIEPINNK